ncbi:MAG: protein kinase [Myxococcota bacterium]|nr:protein kinase [Myxococcota bacterium]
MSLPEDKDEASKEGGSKSSGRNRPDTEPLVETTTKIELSEHEELVIEEPSLGIDPQALISDLLIEESSEVGNVPEPPLRTDSNTSPVNRDHLNFLNQADALETIDDLDLEEKFREQLEGLLQKGEETARLDLDVLNSDDDEADRAVSPNEPTGQINIKLAELQRSEDNAFRTETNRAKHEDGGLVVFNQELVNPSQTDFASEVIFETGEYVRPKLDEDEFADRVPSVGGVFGPYRLLGCLAVGGMAEIFMAIRRDDPDMTPLALKRIRKHRTSDNDSITMFQEEGKICLALSHPNIVNYRDFDVLDGVPYLVMDFIEGMDLQSLADHCNMSSRAIVEVGLSVSQALGYAHSLTNEKNEPRKLVHRDVSPQNILIDRRGTVKLVDFGIARFEGRSFQTGVGPRRGKLGYMAPEQLNYEHPVDLRADLFSLGLVLSEMFLGKNLMPNGPLVAGDLSRTIRSSLIGLADELPEELINIITRMASFKVEQRPWSAQEVVDVLSKLLPKMDTKQRTLSDYGKSIVANKVLPADVTIRNLIQGIRDSKRPDEDTKLNDSLDLEEAEVRALLREAAKASEDLTQSGDIQPSPIDSGPSRVLQEAQAIQASPVPSLTSRPSEEPQPIKPSPITTSPPRASEEPQLIQASPVQDHPANTESTSMDESIASAEGLLPAAKPTISRRLPVDDRSAKAESNSTSYGIIIASLIVLALSLTYFILFQG